MYQGWPWGQVASGQREEAFRKRVGGAPRIYLAPSRQARNVGVGEYGTEASRMWPVAEVIAALLRARAVDVRLPGQSLRSAKALATDANSWGADGYVAVHSNAGGGKGPEVFHYPGSVRGEALAEAIYEVLLGVYPGSGRGVKVEDAWTELCDTVAPAVYVEVAFHDNPDDARWIMEHPWGISWAVALGICRWLQIPCEGLPGDVGDTGRERADGRKVGRNQGAATEHHHRLAETTKTRRISEERATRRNTGFPG